MTGLAILQTLVLIAAPGAVNDAEFSSETPVAVSQNRMTVTWEPKEIVNGSPCLFRIKSETPLKSLSGKWLGREIFFDFDGRDGTWYGFGGVGIDADSGRHQLVLEAATTRGSRMSSSHSVPVGRANYQTIALRVPRRYTEPDAETQARIRDEQAFKREVFKSITPSRLWSGAFAAPIESVITDKFGKRRTFNGMVQSTHNGLDLRAGTGTPVGAMNSGAVLIARELFYEGGFVVLDHGHGLLSLYMHLSEIKVAEGDRVKRGQVVGLSGESGRTTAPHLHVGIRWQGVYVDPAVLLQMQMP
jgi:murein DD-endopeptidase MepM/ murein hydrolase activator NlpD